jgi:hypothetical protein
MSTEAGAGSSAALTICGEKLESAQSVAVKSVVRVGFRFMQTLKMV